MYSNFIYLIKLVLINKMIIARIVTFSTIIILIIIGLTTLITISTNTKPVSYAMYNDLGCDIMTCNVTPSSELRVPINVDYTIYNREIATLCIDLITRLDNDYPDIPEPKSLTHLIDFKTTLSDKNFCCIWDSPSIVWLTFRGTWNLYEWINNFKISQVSYETSIKKYKNTPLFMKQNRDIMVHEGFISLFDELVSEIVEIINKYKSKTICVSGHSLGAAMATIFGLELQTRGFNTCVYSFGSPRIGNWDLKYNISDTKLPYFRFANTEDQITVTPTPVSPNWNKHDDPYFYTHSGELFSFTENVKSISHNHSLYVYLKNLPP